MFFDPEDARAGEPASDALDPGVGEDEPRASLPSDLFEAAVALEGEVDFLAPAADAVDAPEEPDRGDDPPEVGLMPPHLALPPPGLLGYTYWNGRTICRIQRGMGDGNRMWVNCYRHPGCRLNISEEGGPTDLQVYEWLFEVPRALPVPRMTQEERVELRKRHEGIGRLNWGKRGRR